MKLRILQVVFVTALVALVPVSVATAQQAVGQEVLDLIRIRPEETIATATGWLNGLGLPRAIENISWALLLLLFASQAVHATTTGSGMAMQQALARLLIGGTMLSVAPAINGWVRDSFMAFYSAGAAIWDRSVQPQLVAAASEYGGRVVAVFTVLQGIAWAGETAIGDLAGLDAVGNTLLQLFMGSARITLFLLAVVMGFYMVLQFTAGMLIYLAQVFTPVAAAGLTHPRTEEWFGRWLRNIVHALLLTVMVNVLFGLAVQAGFAGPLERQSKALQVAVEQIRAGGGGLPGDALKGAFRAAVISLLLPVTTIVGLVFGVVALWQAEARVASFIGAVAAGIPMWLPFLRLSGFGRGGSSARVPPASSPSDPRHEGSRGWFTKEERAEMVPSPGWMPPPGGARWQLEAGERVWFTREERAEMVVEPHPTRPIENGAGSVRLSATESKTGRRHPRK